MTKNVPVTSSQHRHRRYSRYNSNHWRGLLSLSLLLLVMMATTPAAWAQSRIGEQAGKGAAVGSVIGFLVTGDLWGAAEGAAVGAAAGATSGAVSQHQAKRRQEAEELRRYRAEEMRRLEQQRLVEQAERERATALQRQQKEAERREAEQQLAQAKRERARLEQERSQLAAQRRELEVSLAKQRKEAIATGEITAPAIPETEEQWLAAIGEDSYNGLVALIECQHDRARLLGQVAMTTDNRDYRLAGKWVEALTALDLRDMEAVNATYEELVIIDEDADTVQQVSILADQALMDMRNQRRSEGIACT